MTVGLILKFAQAMADKMAENQAQYGDSWCKKYPDWPVPICHNQLMVHLSKGDPVDVANYCAFLFFFKLNTKPCLKNRIPK